MPSYFQAFTQTFNGNLVTSFPFTIVAPPSVPIKDLSKLKAVLKRLEMDDGGSLGTFNAPLVQGQVFVQNNIWEVIATGTNEIQGNVINAAPPGAGVLAEIEWIYEGDDCPDGHLKCMCNTYPGYCCIPCSQIKQALRG